MRAERLIGSATFGFLPPTTIGLRGLALTEDAFEDP